MAFKALIVLSLLAVALPGWADTATDYFHRGAQFYVFGEKQKAKAEVETGLMLFPQDKDLHELAALMKKEEEQQQQQQQQNQQQDQQDQQQNSQQQQQQSNEE